MVTPGQLNRRAALFEQLASMIAAGVPLPKAMEMAGRNRSGGVPQRVIHELTGHLQEGHTFTDAMQLVSGQKRGIRASLMSDKTCWLSDFDVAMLSAGEESGRLDTAFKRLARDYASRAAIVRDTISQTIVTAVTLHVALLVFPLGFLVAFVLGIMNGKFSECLPFIIEKIAVFGVLWSSIWFAGFAGQGTRNEGWRSVLEAFTIAVPILGNAVKFLVVSRLAMALETLTGAGVPLVRAWEISASACGSPRLKRELLRWTPKLESGSTPAEMVSQIRYFPDMFVQLYESGEISGKLDDTLTHLHTYFQDEGFRKLQAFCRIASFVIYFIIAGSVGYLVISSYLQYFNQAMGAF